MNAIVAIIEKVAKNPNSELTERQSAVLANVDKSVNALIDFARSYGSTTRYVVAQRFTACATEQEGLDMFKPIFSEVAEKLGKPHRTSEAGKVLNSWSTAVRTAISRHYAKELARVETEQGKRMDEQRELIETTQAVLADPKATKKAKLVAEKQIELAEKDIAESKDEIVKAKSTVREKSGGRNRQNTGNGTGNGNDANPLEKVVDNPKVREVSMKLALSLSNGQDAVNCGCALAGAWLAVLDAFGGQNDEQREAFEDEMLDAFNKSRGC